LFMNNQAAPALGVRAVFEVASGIAAEKDYHLDVASKRADFFGDKFNFIGLSLRQMCKGILHREILYHFKTKLQVFIWILS